MHVIFVLLLAEWWQGLCSVLCGVWECKICTRSYERVTRFQFYFLWALVCSCFHSAYSCSGVEAYPLFAQYSLNMSFQG